MAPTAEQIALVVQYLPEAARLSVADGGYGWDDVFISGLMSANAYTPAQAVRFFWYQRTQETAEYLDLSGKSLTVIHRQAKEMLEYWDKVIQTNPTGMEPLDPDGANPNDHKDITFGEIEHPRDRMVRR